MLFGALLPEKNRALDCAFCCSPSCKKSCSRLCFLLLSFVQKIVLDCAKIRSLDCARCCSLFSFNIHFWYSVTTSTCSYSHIFPMFSPPVFKFSSNFLNTWRVYQTRPHHFFGRWAAANHDPRRWKWDIGRVWILCVASGVNVVNDCHASAGDALRVVNQSKHALKSLLYNQNRERGNIRELQYSTFFQSQREHLITLDQPELQGAWQSIGEKAETSMILY